MDKNIESISNDIATAEKDFAKLTTTMNVEEFERVCSNCSQIMTNIENIPTVQIGNFLSMLLSCLKKLSTIAAGLVSFKEYLTDNIKNTQAQTQTVEQPVSTPVAPVQDAPQEEFVDPVLASQQRKSVKTLTLAMDNKKAA